MATVLVIDDEQIDLELIANILQRKGHTVLKAGNYFQAINIFRDRPSTIDMLVADVAMPNKNGCELAKELLEIKPELAVLFVSGFVGAEVCKLYGIELNDLHLLSKPLLSDALAGRVDEILRSPRQSPFAIRPKVRTAGEPPL